MRIIKIFSGLFFLVLAIPATAQDFRGGEIRVTRIDDVIHYGMDIYLYFNTETEAGLDTILFSNGGGPPWDTITVEEITDLYNGVQEYHYYTETFFGGVDDVTLFINYFFEANVFNYSDTTFLTVQTDFNRKFFAGWPYNENVARWEDFDFNYYIDEQGDLRMQLTGWDVEEDVRYRSSRRLSSIEDWFGWYEFPAPIDSLHLGGFTGEFIWRSPPGPGRYLFGFDLLEMWPNSNSVLNRFERLIVIELTEEDFITNTAAPPARTELRVFPNPAARHFTVELADWPGASLLQVRNLHGQLLLEEQLDCGAICQQTYFCTEWPAGVYLLEISNGERRLTKKLLVE